ncbi:MAG TPA: hypothetical protein PLE12_10140 [Propionicimonas sp.]|nr:hypothetical protein [Propionicimonas sp.]
MKRRALAAGIAVLAVAGVGLASASTLNLSARPLSTSEVTHPCPGSATATTGSTGSTLANGVSITLPAGCANRSVQLSVLNGTTVVATGSPTVVAGGSGVLTTAAYTASNSLTVKATVDGWDLPVTWSWTPHVTCRVTDVATVPCTATVALFTGIKPGGTGTFSYYDVVVTSPSATAVRWEVTFDLTRPFYPSVPAQLGNLTLDVFNDGQTTWNGDTSTATPSNDVTRTSTCAAYPGSLVVVGDVVGPTRNRFETVRADRVRQFSLVLNYDVPDYRDVIWTGCTP